MCIHNKTQLLTSVSFQNMPQNQKGSPHLLNCPAMHFGIHIAECLSSNLLNINRRVELLEHTEELYTTYPANIFTGSFKPNMNKENETSFCCVCVRVCLCVNACRCICSCMRRR